MCNAKLSYEKKKYFFFKSSINLKKKTISVKVDLNNVQFFPVFLLFVRIKKKPFKQN